MWKKGGFSKNSSDINMILDDTEIHFDWFSTLALKNTQRIQTQPTKEADKIKITKTCIFI